MSTATTNNQLKVMAMTNGSEDSEAERTVLCEKIIGDIEAVLVKDSAL